ncbi:beta-ketoacyl-[acyl-carrier-protein] synthase family protein [Streptomyces sp. NPDC050560]|uniref:beta-ketoacyl-[acyl-carrier-protein] synthase family protein n=1 Tax=Streptomyces sp. NPDC050560 TaxID=3365630 RepID=UPI0037A081CD
MPAAPDVAVTGLGLITPAGLTVEDNWATLCAGRSLATRDRALAGLPVDFTCRAPAFDAAAELGRARAFRLDRAAHLALLAARAAVADAGLDPRAWPGERVGVVLGTGGNSLDTYPTEFGHLNAGRHSRISPLALPRSIASTPAGEVAIDLRALGPSFATASSCASAATAIGIARDLLRSGTCDIVLTGGSAAPRDAMSVLSFTRMKALSRRAERPEEACRPFDADRDGFVLGEGAAVLVMERVDDARARRARAWALLRGYGSTCDAHHPLAPLPDGAGAARAVRTALDDAGAAPEDIGHINAHGTATRLGDEAEGAALVREFGDCPPPVTAAKGVVGHSLSAAGALEAAYTILSLHHQRIPPTANFRHQDDAQPKLDIVAGAPRPTAMRAALSSSFGFGGHNAVLLFTTP